MYRSHCLSHPSFSPLTMEAQVCLWTPATLTLVLALVVLAEQLPHPTGKDPWSNFAPRSWPTMEGKKIHSCTWQWREWFSMSPLGRSLIEGPQDSIREVSKILWILQVSPMTLQISWPKSWSPCIMSSPKYTEPNITSSATQPKEFLTRTATPTWTSDLKNNPILT